MSAELAGKRVAILAEELYEDPELWYPYYRLLEAGAEVKIVGSGRAETFKSKHGYPVTPDLSIDKTLPENFDAVIIPGGYSPDHMRRDGGMVKLVRDAAARKIPMAAICHGPWMLCSTDVLRGRQPCEQGPCGLCGAIGV